MHGKKVFYPQDHARSWHEPFLEQAWTKTKPKNRKKTYQPARSVETQTADAFI